jgi:hypothetical protein
MRTLALALAAALPVWLAAPAAEAVCTSGVDCIRERFGTDPMLRNNRIIDRTDGLGDRNRPVNPYAARQGLRVAPGNRTIYAPTGPETALETLQPNQSRPDAGAYMPGTGTAAPTVGSALGPVRVIGPGGAQQDADAAAQPYAPAEAATGPATRAGQTGVYSRTARPAPRDPNQPYAGAQPPGVNR